MLLLYGMGRQPGNWHVKETKAPMYARIYYIRGGETLYRDVHTEKALLPGHLYVFPPHTSYEMITNPENPIDCLYLHIDLRSANLTRLISISLEQEKEISHLVQVIMDAVQSNYPADYMEKLALAFESLCVIRGYIETLDASTSQYIDALRSVYRTDMRLDEISYRLGYSTEHFIRIFKKRMGVSPHQYMISLRMSDAIRMLVGDSSLDEISIALGYRNERSFSNAFRKYYGISPHVYRTHYTNFV